MRSRPHPDSALNDHPVPENVSRRALLKGGATLATAAPLASLGIAASMAPLGALANANPGSSTARASAHLQQLVARLDASFSSEAWDLRDANEQAEGRLMLLNTLSHALDSWLHADPARPAFKRWHTPEKKLLGDNPDAIYFDAPISAEHSYRISGNIAGATYTSFTVEVARDGNASGQLGAVLNDTDFAIDENGNYEIIASAKKPAGDVDWLPLAPGTRSLTTRHYFELVENVSADRLKHIPLLVENLENPGPAPLIDDEAVAEKLMRVAGWLQATVFPPSPERSPHWVSQVPNQFSPPKLDDTNLSVGYAAKDNTYAMTWFELEPDQALVIRGRWPTCRFASIVLQNLFMQTLDYLYRNVSVNRAQAVADDEGRFELIVAGRDPGRPNWLDTEGRRRGVVFCRFQLVEGDIEPLQTEVVPLASL